MRHPRILTTLLAMAAWPGAAGASGLQARTHREPLPAREVERPLVFPRGRNELVASLEHAAFEGAGGDGRRWTEGLTVRTGILPGHELWAALGWHQASRASTSGEGRDRAHSLADPRFGWRASLLRREPPNTSVAAEVAARAPAARDGAGPGWSPAFTTGSWEVSAGLAARRAFGPLALDLTCAGVAHPPGRASSGPRPGSAEVRSAAGLLLQAGPAYGQASLGASLPGPGADDRSVWAELGGVVQLTRGVRLGLERRILVLGAPVPLTIDGPVPPADGALVAHLGIAW